MFAARMSKFVMWGCIIVGVILVSFALNGVVLGAEEKELTDSISYEWTVYGKGEKKLSNHIIYLREKKDSDGMVLVSSKSYSKRLVLSFEIMPLNPLTVVNVMMSANNSEDEESLNIPYNYSGDRKFWVFSVKSYYFSFGNSSDNQHPQLLKLPGNDLLAEAVENLLAPGVFNTVEVGRRLSRFWLSINGREIFRVTDRDKLDAGHIAIRIHGNFAERGACLLRNFKINER